MIDLTCPAIAFGRAACFKLKTKNTKETLGRVQVSDGIVYGLNTEAVLAYLSDSVTVKQRESSDFNFKYPTYSIHVTKETQKACFAKNADTLTISNGILRIYDTAGVECYRQENFNSIPLVMECSLGLDIFDYIQNNYTYEPSEKCTEFGIAFKHINTIARAFYKKDTVIRLYGSDLINKPITVKISSLGYHSEGNLHDIGYRIMIMPIILTDK